MKCPQKIVLKRCMIDELGFSNLKGNGFEPNFNYYKKDDKIIIRVEAPGNSTISSKVEYSGEYTVIRLSGKKKPDKDPKNKEEGDRPVWENGVQKGRKKLCDVLQCSWICDICRRLPIW